MALQFRDPFRPEEQYPPTLPGEGGDGGDGGETIPVTIDVSFGADPADVTLTITSQTPEGDWTVDWGDGQPESLITSGVVATNHYLDTTAGTTYQIKVTTDYGSLTQPLTY